MYIFEVRRTVVCNECGNLYHKSCIEGSQCPVCLIVKNGY